jgi:hypothetical protein
MHVNIASADLRDTEKSKLTYRTKSAMKISTQSQRKTSFSVGEFEYQST